MARSRYSNILDFERDIPRPRSSSGAELPFDATILDAANAVVANNASRKAKALWTAGDGERIRVFAASDEYAEAGIRRLRDRAAYR